MLKSVQLKLLKIKYSGNSIGDDIRVEIEALGKFLRVDKIIKAGTTVEINREVGGFETDQKALKFNTQIVVIEKDLLFNDVGQTNLEIKVDATDVHPQQFSHKIEIKETRSIFGKIWGKKTAVFEIILEAKVEDAIKYVPNKGDGWLNAKLEDGSVESLPAYLKVKIENKDNKREYFTIIEGVYRGKYASVNLREDGSTQFISDITHTAMISVKYSISQQIFMLGGKKYKATHYPQTPWKKGLYDIEMPDAPHRGGEGYLDRARLAKIWFRIGHDGARYLHVGSISRGCMTIIEVEKWDALCEVLLKARKGDFISVGILEVVE